MTDWNSEALPVLEAVYRTTQAPAEPYINQEAINAELGREDGDERTWRTIGELIAGGWIEITTGKYLYERPGWPLRAVLTDRARQLLAGWPATGGELLYSRFITALDDAIAGSTDADERTRLERLRADAVDIGKGVIVSVLSNLARVHGVPA